MNIVERARELRPVIEVAAQSLSDEQAVYAPEIFEAWNPNGYRYEAGRKVRWEGVLYRVLQAHTSQPEWNPAVAPSLFARVLIPDPGFIPEWEQPDSTNPYMKHDVVRHNGKTWESQIDHNVWEPGTVGAETLWSEVTQNATEEPETSGTEVSPSEPTEPQEEPVSEPTEPQETTEEEPADPVDEWVQPTGAHDAYNTGDIVLYNGTRYSCTVDNNVYAPGVYGWDETE